MCYLCELNRVSLSREVTKSLLFGLQQMDRDNEEMLHLFYSFICFGILVIVPSTLARDLSTPEVFHDF